MLQHSLSAPLLVPFTSKENGGCDLVTPHLLVVDGSIFLFTTVVYLALLISSNSDHIYDSLFIVLQKVNELLRVLAQPTTEVAAV